MRFYGMFFAAQLLYREGAVAETSVISQSLFQYTVIPAQAGIQCFEVLTRPCGNDVAPES